MKAVDKTLEKKCGWAVLKRTAHSHFLLLAAANATLSWKLLLYLFELHILRLCLLLASTLTCVRVTLRLLCLLLSIDIL